MKNRFLFLFGILFSINVFAQTKLELAEQALENNNYGKAIQCATNHLKEFPNDANALVLRASAFMAQDDNVAALDDMNAAIKHWNKKCTIPLASLYCTRALIYDNLDQEELAQKDYNTAVKKDKKNASCYSNRAKFYYKHQMYEEAEADFRKAVDLNPKDVGNEIEIARCLLKQGKTDNASAILNKVIRYEPMNAEAKYLRASIYFQQEDYKSFVDMFMAYLALEQGDPEMLLSAATKEYAYVLKAITDNLKVAKEEDRYYWLGVRAMVYKTKEQYREALADLSTMKSLLPDSMVNSFILYQTAECHYALYEYIETVDLYSKLIALNTDSDEVYWMRFRRAQAYAGLGKHQQAIADYSVVVENDIELAPYAFLGRGIVKESIKDSDGALEDYNKGLLLDENNIPLRLMRGRLLLLQKQDTIRANADFNKIIEIDTIPENSCRQYALMYMGKYDEAIEWNNKILEIAPNAGNYYDAACLYARMKREKDALKYLKEALELGYRNFVHIDEDSDLDSIRNTQAFKDLLVKYKKEGIQNLFNKLK